jgi:hypothetical protein
VSWSHDYWVDLAEEESCKDLSTHGRTLPDMGETNRVRIVQRTQTDDVAPLRRWILTLFELGATIPMIAKAMRKDRTTVRYHLRECGVFEKKGRAA